MRVVHIKREPYTKYIGRPSRFGNPFSLDKYSRNEAVEKYEQYARQNQRLLQEISRLDPDDILGCFCAPLLCHGDVIVKLWDEIKNGTIKLGD